MKRRDLLDTRVLDEVDFETFKRIVTDPDFIIWQMVYRHDMELCKLRDAVEKLSEGRHD